MTYSIEFKPAAKRQLAKLHKAIALRLQTKIDALAEEPRPPGYIKLQGVENRYRIRIGDYSGSRLNKGQNDARMLWLNLI